MTRLLINLIIAAEVTGIVIGNGEKISPLQFQSLLLKQVI
jgi:hypothetical protein